MSVLFEHAREAGAGMSRSGYSHDLEPWSLICWRGAVKSAIRGKRGQRFLRDIIDALDALPEKKLAAGNLVSADGCCAMGAVAIHKGIDVSGIDPYERDQVASLFDISEALAAEIADLNDDEQWCRPERQSDAANKRWHRMRNWAESNLKEQL